MNEERIRTVFFDLDGTIVDSESKALQVVQRIMPQYIGRTLTTKELRAFKGVPWLEAFRNLCPGYEYEIYDKSLEEWERTQEKLTAYTGVTEAIENLGKLGYILGIVSSKESKYIRMDLDDFSISEYFSVVIGSDDTVRHKPNPEPLIEALRRIQSRPGNAIYIGDQPTDILAARSAGMKSGAALWGEGSYEFLSEAKPDYVFKTPDEIARSLSDGTGYGSLAE